MNMQMSKQGLKGKQAWLLAAVAAAALAVAALATNWNGFVVAPLDLTYLVPHDK